MLSELRRQWPSVVRIVTAMALLAMLFRAVTPAGYMMAPSQDGRFITVTLCSGHGAATSLLDLQTGELVDSKASGDQPLPDEPHKDAPCVFAAATHLAEPETVVVLTTAFRPMHVAAYALVAQTPGRGLAAPLPWATGPPRQV